MDQNDSPPPRRRSFHPAAARFFILVLCMLSVIGTTGCASVQADDHAQLKQSLDRAIERAADYLESQQNEDGAWPSDTYGLFRDGVALTPHVLRSLAMAERDNETTKRAVTFVASKVGYEFATGASNGGHWLSEDVYGPVYFCADAALSQHLIPFTVYGLGSILFDHQITGDPNRQFAQQGGWGYAKMPFAGINENTRLRERFDHGKCTLPVAENLSANISATAYALDAMAITKRPPVEAHRIESMHRAALQFAQRCQNFGTSDKRFDDGGFFFNPADPARNKGGPTGADKDGYARFHSSGSSTADGLRVLLHCGLKDDDPRVIAARDWLFKHFDADHNPGTFNADREILRDAYYFYYAASVADTFTLLGEGPDDWAQDLARALLGKQLDNGSFANPFTDGKEDDPLIATPFALRAMLACRDQLKK